MEAGGGEIQLVVECLMLTGLEASSKILQESKINKTPGTRYPTKMMLTFLPAAHSTNTSES